MRASEYFGRFHRRQGENEEDKRTRSIAHIGALSVVGALALAGCGSSNSSSATGGLTSGSTSGGTSGGTYTIAFQGALSGDNQQLGINEINGVQLAIEQATAKGDLGFKVKLVKSDDAGDSSKSPAAAAKVIQDSNVMGVIGPSFSGPTEAVGKNYGNAGITIV